MKLSKITASSSLTIPLERFKSKKIGLSLEAYVGDKESSDEIVRVLYDKIDAELEKRRKLILAKKFEGFVKGADYGSD